jgi:hypothetical protein
VGDSGANSNIESLDFCAISASESNKVPFKFACDTINALSRLVFYFLKKGILQ